MAPRKSAGDAGILVLIYIMDGAPDRMISNNFFGGRAMS